MDVPGAAGDCAQQGKRLVSRLREQRVADPDRVQPDFFGVIAQLEDRACFVCAGNNAFTCGAMR